MIRICSLRIKSNTGLSFSEIRRLYSIELKNAYPQIEREKIRKS